MSKSVLMSVFDRKAMLYSPPQAFLNDENAKRGYMSLMQAPDEKLTFQLFPEDFAIYYLGTYDLKTGKMDLLPNPEYRWSFVELKPRVVQTHVKVEQEVNQ